MFHPFQRILSVFYKRKVQKYIGLMHQENIKVRNHTTTSIDISSHHRLNNWEKIVAIIDFFASLKNIALTKSAEKSMNKYVKLRNLSSSSFAFEFYRVRVLSALRRQEIDIRKNFNCKIERISIVRSQENENCFANALKFQTLCWALSSVKPWASRPQIFYTPRNENA